MIFCGNLAIKHSCSLATVSSVKLEYLLELQENATCITDLQPFPPVRLNRSIPFHGAKLVGHWDELVGPVPYLALPLLRHWDQEALHIRLRPTKDKINGDLGLDVPPVLGAYHQDSQATVTELISDSRTLCLLCNRLV